MESYNVHSSGSGSLAQHASQETCLRCPFFCCCNIQLCDSAMMYLPILQLCGLQLGAILNNATVRTPEHTFWSRSACISVGWRAWIRSASVATPEQFSWGLFPTYIPTSSVRVVGFCPQHHLILTAAPSFFLFKF